MRITAVEAQSGRRHEHARKCKNFIADCKLCKDNIRYFSEIPVNQISLILQDTVPRRLHTSFASVALDSMMDRTLEFGQRAKRDVRAAGGWLKQYESQGGRL